MPHTDPQATVDVVLLTLMEGRLHVALLQRQHEDEPYCGHWALPGGFVHTEEDQDADDTAVRVLRDKVGFSCPYLEQLRTFSGRSRDPRRWSLSVAYYALVPSSVLAVRVGCPAVKWAPVDGLKSLPFDHLDIVRFAVERLRSKASYSSLPLYLMDDCFTLTQAQAVYEAVMGGSLDSRGFRRRLAELGVIEPVGEPTIPTGGGQMRPAQHYRLRPGLKGAAHANSVMGVRSS